MSNPCAPISSGYCESNSKPIYQEAELQFLSPVMNWMSVCVCLQFISWRLTLDVVVFEGASQGVITGFRGRSWGWWSPMMWVVSFTREERLALTLSAVGGRTQQEAALQARKRELTKNCICKHLDLELPTPPQSWEPKSAAEDCCGILWSRANTLVFCSLLISGSPLQTQSTKEPGSGSTTSSSIDLELALADYQNP